jgi:hypothetical protein
MAEQVEIFREILEEKIIIKIIRKVDTIEVQATTTKEVDKTREINGIMKDKGVGLIRLYQEDMIRDPLVDSLNISTRMIKNIEMIIDSHKPKVIISHNNNNIPMIINKFNTKLNLLSKRKLKKSLYKRKWVVEEQEKLGEL